MILKHTLENAKGLKSLALQVDTVSTAEAMLEQFHRQSSDRTWEYSFVVVDERLSDAEGVLLGSEGVFELRRQGCVSKIIMCSCFCSDNDQQRYMEAGADMVWPKPYPQISDMNSSLRSLLQLPEDSGRSYPKVLVVEDDEVNAMILKQVLEESPRLRSLELRVDTITTVEKMLELFETSAGERQNSWSYSVVIVDQVLTDAGGVLKGSEGVSKLKEKGCKSKFVICSGMCTPKDREIYKAAGADHVWTKPLPDVEEIDECMRTFLRTDEDRAVIEDIKQSVDRIAGATPSPPASTAAGE
eukprot:g1092.t1